MIVTFGGGALKGQDSAYATHRIVGLQPLWPWERSAPAARAHCENAISDQGERRNYSPARQSPDVVFHQHAEIAAFTGGAITLANSNWAQSKFVAGLGRIAHSHSRRP